MVTDLENTVSVLIIYPNPAREFLTVQWGEENDLSVTVLDMMGRSMICEDLNKDQYSLDIRNLPPGSYLLRTTSRSKIQVQKLSNSERFYYVSPPSTMRWFFFLLIKSFDAG